MSHGVPNGLTGSPLDDLIADLRNRPCDLESSLLLAGKRGHIRAFGRTISAWFRLAMGHLEVAADNCGSHPDVSIHLVESPATALVNGFANMTSTLSRSWSSPNLDVRSSDDGRLIFFGFSSGSSLLLDRWRHILVGYQFPEHMPLFERTKPLLLPLRVCLHDLGVHLIHAGLVADRDRGVLIAGPERAGKSTISLSCFADGFQFLGDDQTALTADANGYIGHSLYNTVQARPDWLEKLGSFPQHAVDRGSSDDKNALFLSELATGRVGSSALIRVVLLPRVNSVADTVFSRASKAEALIRIAPSTLFQPLGAGGQGLECLRNLVDRVPAYWFDAGRDLEQIPVQIRQLLAVMDPA